MASFNKFHAFVEHLAEKVHNLGADQLALALCAVGSAPVNTNAVLADLTTIAYTNLSSRNLVTSSSAQTTGTYKPVVADLVLTASGGAVAAFRYVVVFNDTPSSPADPLIGWYDYASALTLNDGETLTFDADGTNGLLQIALKEPSMSTSIGTAQAAIEQAQAAYLALQAKGTRKAEIYEAGLRVKAARKALSDLITAGARACPICASQPIGIRQPLPPLKTEQGPVEQEEFEVGCPKCGDVEIEPAKTIADPVTGDRMVIKRAVLARVSVRGAGPAQAVAAWNTGRDAWTRRP